MPPRPPRILEAFFGHWIPPAAREEVLGDLAEKYASPLQYFVLAVRTIPCVIFSRARRVTEAPVLFMLALLVYGCYLVAAFYRDSAFLNSPAGLLRAALPLVPFVIVTTLCDVYYTPARTPLHVAGRVAFASLSTFLLMSRFACGSNSVCLARTLPGWMNFLGASATLLLVTAVRILFRSDPDMQQAAGPAQWLRQTTAPVALSPGAVGVVAKVLAITAGAILGLSIGLKPGGVGIVIVLLLLFGFSLHRPRKD